VLCAGKPFNNVLKLGGEFLICDLTAGTTCKMGMDEVGGEDAWSGGGASSLSEKEKVKDDRNTGILRPE
jgi:hypothetical protein